MMKRAHIALFLLAGMIGFSFACAPRSAELPEDIKGHCTYQSRFSQLSECHEYLGTEWTTSGMEEDCRAKSGQLEVDKICPKAPNLGYCVIGGGTEQASRTYAMVEDTSKCGSNQQGCELFGGGVWEPNEICGGVKIDDYTTPTAAVFQPGVLECSAPVDGEPAGKSDDDEVCTWSMIGGCTEEGRKYEDYASCEPVRTQRPYYAAPANEADGTADPRLKDPEYKKELDWVKSQIEACACVCCHSESAPQGPANWYVEAPGNFMSTFYDSGLAFGAMYTDSKALGAFQPDDNNGFDRITSAFPTTDTDRMLKFFEKELEFRGKSKADYPGFESAVPGLDAQLEYEPKACENGEMVKPDGTVNWVGGPARYVYVMEADTRAPGAPPNLDKPEGTLWKLDVYWDKEPLRPGEIMYGQVPDGTKQVMPAEGAPAELEEGKQYYIYVQADVIVPITRCLFTYGESEAPRQ